MILEMFYILSELFSNNGNTEALKGRLNSNIGLLGDPTDVCTYAPYSNIVLPVTWLCDSLLVSWTFKFSLWDEVIVESCLS